MATEKYKKDTKIHWSFLFSYWIFIWFLIYIFSFSFDTSIAKWIQNYCNPLLVLRLALLENLFSFFMLYYYNTKSFILFKYVLVILILKVIPIYALRNTKINIVSNVTILVFLFLLYELYLQMYGTNVIEIYRDTYQHIINDDGKTPIFLLIDTLFGSK